MGYVKRKYVKSKKKSYTCPECGSNRIEQKHDTGDFKYWCIACYWHGEKPIIQDRAPAKNTKATWCTVEYEEIIRNLLSGKTIIEQFEAFGVPLGASTDGRLSAVKNKILRVYSCYHEYTGGRCEDPELVKMKVTDDVRDLVISAIEDEETKIRNAPRLSVTFSK